MRLLWAAFIVCLISLCAGAAHADGTPVTLFNNTAYAGGWGSGLGTQVTLPDASTMAGFNSMHIAMTMACTGGTCPPWDFVASLYACPDANNVSGSTCTTEIARWITAYGAGGSWTTDISPMLAILRKGGTQAFWFSTPQPYTLTTTLTLDTANDGDAPSRAIPLWGGGNLDLNYNPAHAPITVSFAQKPVKAQLFTLVTGHGWGANAEDCAEFCDIAEHFGVGGQDYTVSFPQAGSNTGCQDLVSQGVVPNQAGSWQFGRDGWCPGWDVHPFVADVTASLRDGNNTLTYAALYNGQPYNPTPVSNPDAQAIGPSINLASYLVVWDAPAAVTPAPLPAPTSSPNAPTPGGGGGGAAGAAGATHFDSGAAGCTSISSAPWGCLIVIVWCMTRRRNGRAIGGI